MTASLKVCAVHDRAADAYGRPVFVPATGLAIRSFMDECANPQSDIGRHPADYALYLVAEYDESSGVFHPTESGRPVLLMLGSQTGT